MRRSAAFPRPGLSIRSPARTGAGPVRDAPAFVRYRDMQNVTPHACDAERAGETVAAVDEFLRDTRVLLAALRGRDGAAD